jgi:DNA-binding NtrC family response regulator
MARILIVEDEAQILVFTEAVLQEAGHQTFSASDVTQALAVLDAEKELDLLVTDVQLRDDLNGGLTVAQEAGKRHPGIQVLYATGAQVTDGMKALFVDGSEVLSKPYVPQQLLEATDRMLARSTARRSA